MASWQQWAVKAASAIALTVMLGIAWPTLLAYAHPSGDDIRTHWSYVAVVIAFTASSLYVSSVSSSGVKALLISIPGIPIVIALLGLLVAQFDRALNTLWSGRPTSPSDGGAYLTLWMAFGMAAGFFVLVLYFAMLNHRSSERGFARAWPQAIWMLGYLMAGFSLVSIVLAFR
jgi:hypothetical protein